MRRLPSMVLFLLLTLLAAGCSPGGSGRPAAEVPAAATVILAGDAMVHEPQLAEWSADRDAFREQLAGIAGTVRAADLAVVNVETLLTPERPSGDPTAFGAPPEFAAALAGTGFDVAGVANNHAVDRGVSGLAASQDILRQTGLVPVGGKVPLVLRPVPGGTVAVLSLTSLSNREPAEGMLLAYGSPEASSALAAGRKGATAVIVMLHAGTEYDGEADAALTAKADALLAAGADVVAVAHPHVAGRVERREHGYVAWSLGNVLGGRPVGFRGSAATGGVDLGLLLRVRLSGGRVEGVEAVPVYREGDSGRVRMVLLGDAKGKRAGSAKTRARFLCGDYLAWE